MSKSSTAGAKVKSKGSSRGATTKTNTTSTQPTLYQVSLSVIDPTTQVVENLNLECDHPTQIYNALSDAARAGTLFHFNLPDGSWRSFRPQDVLKSTAVPITKQ